MRELTGSEVRDSGLLQEVNRRFLMPLGIALRWAARGDGLGLHVLEDGEHLLGDAIGRGGKDPWYFSGVARAKAMSVARMAVAHAQDRATRYGFIVEPIPGWSEVAPVTLSDDDQTVGRCVELADAVAQRFYNADSYPTLQPTLTEAILAEVVGPLLAEFEIHPGDLLKVGVSIANAPAQKEDSPLGKHELGRALWLARELPRLARTRIEQQPGENGEPVEVERLSQLKEAEVEEADVLCAQVASWHLNDLPEDAPKALARLEELFELAQPGMAFWRGDLAARERVLAMKDRIGDLVERYRGERSEVEAFLNGALPASSVRDPEGLRAVVQARLEPLQQAIAALESDRLALEMEARPLQAALARLA